MLKTRFLNRFSWTVAVLPFLATCGDTTEPEIPVVTSIVISPTSSSMTFLGEQVSLTASVRDQNNQPISAVVVWSVDDVGVATVSPAGVLTAVGDGPALVLAAVGSVSQTAAVSVGQVASQVTVVSGNGQSGGVGQLLASNLVVQSSDGGGAVVGNVDVSFAVTGGNGSLSVTTVRTDAQGLASSSWTLGTQEGAQQVTVSIDGVSGGAVPFSATATDFQIELVFINNGTASQDAAFVSAADRWMSILRGELTDVDFSLNPVAADGCLTGQPVVNDVVDDLRVFVRIITIDGPGGTLGQAGPCSLHSDSNLPVLGFMEFDSADVANLEAAGDLIDVALHEMGHVLGIGTLWDSPFALVQDPSLPSSPGVDTYFTGTFAIAAFDAAGGTSYTGGNKVPVENLLGEGSGDVHWRESVLMNELMTPALNGSQPNPLSAITTQSLADLGYTVDSSQADAFSEAFAGPARLLYAGAPPLDLSNDAYLGRLLVVNSSGRVVRVLRP